MVELHGAFADQPHFGMDVMVRGMRHAARRQHRFMGFQRFAGGQLAFQNGAKLGHPWWLSTGN